MIMNRIASTLRQPVDPVASARRLSVGWISKRFVLVPALVLSSLTLLGGPVSDDAFSFSTGDPDSLVGTASHPDSAGQVEIETADDFILSSSTIIDHATITGLLPA